MIASGIVVSYSEFTLRDMASFKSIINGMRNTGGGENNFLTTETVKHTIEVTADKLLNVVNSSMSKSVTPKA